MDVLISDMTDLINKYEKYRGLANDFGKVIILKDKQPDSVLLPITEYEKLSSSAEKSDKSSKTGVVDLVRRLPPAGQREVYTLAHLKHDLFSAME